ncbi:sensor of ECF-type sigma factor [Flavobacterium sp.]|jgi:alpha-galactosidase/6-phospho-beta-glucosidase family protein|uniref:sensor of ECF-type sigma factor n=1 Tax=Flavobacterium sp. TaxID=239 RepID=UPI0025F4F11F|nr:sensor of ECF-type sigma factor [Flavobacterium sp.]
MKPLKIIIVLLLLTSFNFYAQGDNMKEKREQIKTMKIAFLTTELDLNSTEAEKFWPIYNTFEEKEFELKHLKMRSFIKKYKEGKDKMSEKEASTLLNQIENNEEEIFVLRKKFIGNLKGILPASKIIRLKKSEEDFNRKLLMQYRNKGQRKE